MVKVVVITRLLIDPLADREISRFTEGMVSTFAQSFIQKRLDLFEEFALPSMKFQRVPPALWLIAYDHMLEGEVRLRAFELPGFARLLRLGATDRLADVVRAIIENFGDDVLTIRLDSDDKLAPDFVRLAARRSRPYMGLNFRHGIEVFLPAGLIIHRSIASNMAVGFRAGPSCDINVHDFGVHSNVARVTRMVDVWTIRPMWMKVAHDANISYIRPNGVPVAASHRVSKRFNFLARDVPRRLKFHVLVSWVGHQLNQISPRLATLIEKQRSAHRRAS